MLSVAEVDGSIAVLSISQLSNWFRNELQERNQQPDLNYLKVQKIHSKKVINKTHLKPQIVQ